MSDSKKPKKKERASELLTSTDVLQSLLQNSKSGLSDQFLRWKLWGQWAQVVGASIGSTTVPVSFDRGTLYVWVKSAAWMQEMRFFAGEIKDRVNAFAGRHWVLYIRFTLDRHEVPEPETAPSKWEDILAAAKPPQSTDKY